MQPYRAEALRAERAGSADDEAQLLGAVAPERRAQFLRDYLSLLWNESVLLEIDSGRMCPVHHYIAIDPDTLEVASWNEMYWGPPPERFWEELPPGWGADLEYPIIIDCDNPGQALPLIETYYAQRLRDEEATAEAILANMMHEFLAEQLRVDTTIAVELEASPVLTVILYRTDVGPAEGVVQYYPWEGGWEAVQTAQQEVDAAVASAGPYRSLLSDSNVAALATDPTVPIIVEANGFWGFPGLMNGIAHQIMASNPLGQVMDPDIRTIEASVAIILERELSRDFLRIFYPDALQDPSVSYVFSGELDDQGMHLPRPVNPFVDPAGDPLSRSVFDLRNCTIAQGLSIGEFLDLVRDMAGPDEIYAALDECRGPVPSPTPADTQACAVFAGALSGDRDRNLLGNASFEYDPFSGSTLWQIETRGGDLIVSPLFQVARTGGRSISLRASDFGLNGWPGIITGNTIPLCGGREYMMSVWAYSADGAGAWAEIELIDPLGGPVHGVSSGCTPLPSEEWTELTVQLAVPEFPSGLAARLGLLQCPTVDGVRTVLYYDDVFFGPDTSPR
jgi:hypothetical protein